MLDSFKIKFRGVISYFRRLVFSLEKQAIHDGVKLGEDNFIASHFWDTEPYLIKVGSHCQITAGVRFYTHGGAGAVRRWYPKFDTFGRVTVGDYVYIGNDAKIMPGVTIGDNVLIAAGSIVTKSIPSNVVVAGNPAKYICSIEDYIERNMKYNTDTKGLSFKCKKTVLCSMPDDRFIRKDFIKTSKTI